MVLIPYKDMKRRYETLIAVLALLFLLVISVLVIKDQNHEEESSYKPEIRKCETHSEQIGFMNTSTSEVQESSQTYWRDADLIETASDVLTTYKETKTCALAFSGYLDLMGKQWACVVHGGSWVDCVFVNEKTSDTTEVTTLRFSSDDPQWKEIVDVWLGEMDSKL